MKTLATLHAEQKKNFIEKGADLEHERWSGWQKYLHSLCYPHTLNSLNAVTKQYEDIQTGGLVIHRDRVEHWERQIATPYSELTEKEKEYDRIETRKYVPLLDSYLLSQIDLMIEIVMSKKKKIYDNWATTHDRDEERWTKLTKEEKGYNTALSDLSTLLQAQRKLIEEQ